MCFFGVKSVRFGVVVGFYRVSVVWGLLVIVGVGEGYVVVRGDGVIFVVILVIVKVVIRGGEFRCVLGYVVGGFFIGGVVFRWGE